MSKIFSSPSIAGPKPEPPPVLPPPTLMEDTGAIEASRRKSVREQRARSGVASTMLSQPSGSGSGMATLLGPG